MSIWRHQKAFDRLEDRLARLEAKSDETERTIRKLDLEFGDLYDKVKRQMSRMSKRAALDAKELVELNENEVVIDPLDTTDPISRSILRRRGIRRQAE